MEKVWRNWRIGRASGGWLALCVSNSTENRLVKNARVARKLKLLVFYLISFYFCTYLRLIAFVKLRVPSSVIYNKTCFHQICTTNLGDNENSFFNIGRAIEPESPICIFIGAKWGSFPAFLPNRRTEDESFLTKSLRISVPQRHWLHPAVNR